MPVEVTEHKTLNSSKGIIRKRILRTETEENILEYLKPQGVTHVKRVKIKKNGELVNTNTLLLTFNTVVTPKTLKIFYQIIPVDLYVPNPLRCLTVRNLVTIKATVLLMNDQYANDAVQAIMIIFLASAEIHQNVSIVVEITCQDQVTVMSGKKKKKS